MTEKNCRKNQAFSGSRGWFSVCLDFITPAEPVKDNRQRFSSPNPIFSGLWA